MKAALSRIPPGIWALGFVSLFMDASSELVHSLLPVFMVASLGASVTEVGVIEGIAEATAMIVKIFSGALSDYFGRRKLLTLIGYGLAAFSKPLFPLAHSLSAVLAARFADRVGKGIRGAPRDALLSDLAPAELRGACFGLRQSMDTVGAVIGPLLAIVLMAHFAGDMRAVLWAAVIPAALCVATLVFGVKEPEGRRAGSAKNPISREALRSLGRPFRHLVALAALLTLARFSEAFLVLKASGVGLPPGMVPLVLVVMNIIYALAAYPAGALSDRMDRASVLKVGIVLLVAADAVLAGAGNSWFLMAGVGLWGLHMGVTQGLLSAMVADVTPPELRGTAYGALNLACGIALLVSSSMAGLLWDGFGPSATFMAGAALALASLAGLAAVRKGTFEV